MTESTVIYAPLTAKDIMGLLPGLTERTIKREFREHGCCLPDRREFLVTPDQFKRLLKIKELPRSMVPRGSVIYFIECGDLVKIGFTGNFEARLSTLRSLIPGKISVLGTTRGSPALERRFHERFARYRRHGEWFQLTSWLRLRIAEICHG